MVKQQAIVSDDVVDIEEAPSLASSKINEAEASGKRFYPLKLNPLGIFISIPVLLFAGMLTLQSALILVTNIVLPWRDHSPFVSIIGIMFLSFFVISWATVFRWTFARILMVIFGKWGVTIGEDRVVFPGSLRGKKKIPFSSLDYVAIDECSGRTEVNFYRKGQMFFSSFRDITSDKFKDANTWMRFHEDLMAVLKSQAIIYYKNGLAITWRLSCLPEVTQLIEVREIAQSLAKNFSVSSKYVQLDRTEKVDDLAQLISKQIATCRGDIASLNFEVTLFPTLCSRASHIEIRAYTNDFEAHYAIWRNKNTLYIGKRKVERQKKHPKKSIPLQISHK